MVGGSGISTLCFAAFGALAGYVIGSSYFLLAGLLGILGGEIAGAAVGAFGWELTDYFGEKSRAAYVARQYLAGTGGLVATIGIFLLTYGGLLVLLKVLASR